jgi:hypothetical protein
MMPECLSGSNTTSFAALSLCRSNLLAIVNLILSYRIGEKETAMFERLRKRALAVFVGMFVAKRRKNAAA